MLQEKPKRSGRRAEAEGARILRAAETLDFSRENDEKRISFSHQMLNDLRNTPAVWNSDEPSYVSLGACYGGLRSGCMDAMLML